MDTTSGTFRIPDWDAETPLIEILEVDGKVVDQNKHRSDDKHDINSGHENVVLFGESAWSQSPFTCPPLNDDEQYDQKDKSD